jgi:cellulose biosynthesis protein BcsQ
MLPAGTTIYSQQALNASDVVVLPVLADASSYLTLPKSLSMLKRHCLKRDNFDGFMVVLNQVNRSYELNTNITEILKTKFANHVFAEIHQDQAIPEALACGTNVLAYAPE